MKGFDILKVKSAVKARNKFDLSRTHLTTMDFGQIVPLFVEETVPGDKFDVSADFFSRMAPLVKPTYGKFSFKTVSAFVPYHQLAADSDAWFAGKTVWEGATPIQRIIANSELHALIAGSTRYSSSNGATATNCDYYFKDSTGTDKYLLFNSRGKYLVKVLNALGYVLPQGVDLQTGSDWDTSLKNKKFSAYPLLAFFKLYNDYMSQSQRFNSSPLSSLLQNIKYNKTVSNQYNSSNGQVLNQAIVTMFGSLFLNYENDYFTSAWQNPDNAINSIESVNGIGVPSNGSTALGTVLQDANYSDNILAVPVTGSSAQLGQRALNFLRSFDDWVRRNNYSGSRAVQQVYSRFGIKTDDYRSHYANVLSTDTIPVQVGDVTATAGTQVTISGNTEDIALGDYAGKGIMNGAKSIFCSVSDYGLLLILGYFTVAPMNSYGADRRVLRTHPLDYYNPEFDGIGADAISVGEVYCSPIDGPTTVNDNSVFGFTERYNSYRYGRDVITGEFRDYRSNGDMNVWHTGRNLSALRSAGTLVAQSTSMNTLPQTDSEFNRIFSVTSGGVDHFYMIARFNVDAVRPMLNLNQVPNFGEGDTVVPRNGNVIS